MYLPSAIYAILSQCELLQDYSSQVRIGANEISVNFPVSLFCRWSSRYDQWWECKFLSEGIIDQG